jgi:hypothetical protein
MNRVLKAAALVAFFVFMMPALADRYGIGDDQTESSPFTQAVMLVFLGVIIYAMWRGK